MWTRLPSGLIAAALLSVAQSPSSTAITNVTVIDVAAGRGIPAQTVVIEGDRIVSVGPATAVKVRPGVVTVDGTGKFLIPGLWDMHGHLFSNSHKPGTDDPARVGAECDANTDLAGRTRDTEGQHGGHSRDRDEESDQRDERGDCAWSADNAEKRDARHAGIAVAAAVIAATIVMAAPSMIGSDARIA
jgi:predicted amidohydrolase YtcJ